MDHVTGFLRQPHEAAIIILPVLALTGRGRWIGRGDLRLREVQLLAPPHKLVNRRSQNPPPPYAADVPVSPCLPILSFPFTYFPCRSVRLQSAGLVPGHRT